tara:strand:+ start:619 stop:855 length:237 start_codon:yes stop_codon:yes gene_type:complete
MTLKAPLVEEEKREIEKIDTCVHDKAEQIYDMSKQIEKLLDENTLLKKTIKEMQESIEHQDDGTVYFKAKPKKRGNNE